MISLVLAAVAMMPGAPPVQDASKIYRNALPSVMTLEVELDDGVSLGTAFLVGKDGLAVTAHHVIKGGKSATATFADGSKVDVEGVVDIDEYHDVALIRVKSAGRPFLGYAGAHPEVGAKVYTLGAPQGLDFSISDGIIAQLRRLENYVLYQFTCPISQGNSGGPLLDANGKVLGVISMTSAEGQNLNFASCWAYPKALNSAKSLQRFDPSSQTREGPPRKGKRGDDSDEISVGAMGDALFAVKLFEEFAFFVMADMLKPLIQGEPKENFAVPEDTDTIIANLKDCVSLLEVLETPDAQVNKSLREIAVVIKEHREALLEMKELLNYLRKTGWDEWSREKYEAVGVKWVKDAPWEKVDRKIFSWLTAEVRETWTDDFVDSLEHLEKVQVFSDVGFAFDARLHPHPQVGYVWADSPADKAGLKFWDVILKLDGKEFKGWMEAAKYLNTQRGTKVVFRVLRESGDVETISIDVPK